MILGRSRVKECSYAATRQRLTGLRETDEAMAELEKAYDERNPQLECLRLPNFDPLRSDPRFGALLQRMNFIAQG